MPTYRVLEKAKKCLSGSLNYINFLDSDSVRDDNPSILIGHNRYSDSVYLRNDVISSGASTETECYHRELSFQKHDKYSWRRASEEPSRLHIRRRASEEPS